MYAKLTVSQKAQKLPLARSVRSVQFVPLVMAAALTVLASGVSASQTPAFEAFDSDTFTIGIDETLSLPVDDDSIAAVQLFTDAGVADDSSNAPVVTVPAPGVAGPLALAMLFGGRRRRRAG
jgi:MYXO-CTERM domain-containing protein